MKTKTFGCIAMVLLTISCSKIDRVEMSSAEQECGLPTERHSILDLMLSVSADQDLVKIMHGEAEASFNVGLEESIYFEEIINEASVDTKSASGRDLLRDYLLSSFSPYENITRSSGIDTDIVTLNDVEVYWPYSEDWDGVSQPVVVVKTHEGDQYIEDDKTYAYRIVSKDDTTEIETLVVDEEYARHNPVWVIGKSDVPLEDIVHLKHGDFDKTSIIPRVLPETRATSDHVSTLMVTTIQSTQQHDDWVNGGSEYVLYWFFPAVFDKTVSVETNTYGQVKFTRKEIDKKTVKTINFLGNDDWTPEQESNKLKVIEYDPGKNINFEIDLTGSYKGFTGSLKTTITLNNTDDMIMEYVVVRKACLADVYKVSGQENTFSRDFRGSGVIVNTLFRALSASSDF